MDWRGPALLLVTRRQLPDPIVKDSFIEVWNRPGLGVEFNVEAAKKYLPETDKDFLD